MDYAGYNKAAGEYQTAQYAAHPDWREWADSQPTAQGQMGGFGQQSFTGPPAGYQDPYQGWLDSLPPDQRAEFQKYSDAKGAKMDRQSHMAMAAFAALAGGAGLAAMGGAGAAGGLGAAEAGGVGAMGDVGMGAFGAVVPMEGAGALGGVGAMGDVGMGAFGAPTGGMGAAAGDAGMAGWMDGASAWGGGGGNAGTSQSWLQGLMKNFGGGGGSSGGGFGSFMPSTAKDWMSVGSGIYGMYRGNQQDKLAQQALAGSAPWASGGGMANAGAALTNVINGDFTNDPGFKQAQLAAARASSQQPGGAASSAAAMAALKYQNERIAALSGPAGVGFNPAAGYQTALQGYGQGNQLASSSLGSIGYGMSGGSMPPWLQAYLIQHGMGG